MDEFRIGFVQGFRDLFRWQMLVGTLTLGLAIAAVGQAVRGNDSDRLVFSIYAIALITVAGALFARLMRYTRPEVLATGGGLAAYLAAEVHWTRLVSASIGVIVAISLYTVAFLVQQQSK